MGLAIATRFEMNRTHEPANAIRVHTVVAGFVGNLVNLEFLSAKGKHLWHKRHAIKSPLGVECTEDFFLASHYHPVANAQFSLGRHKIWFAFPMQTLR
jgi:hypothetical protein